MLVRDYPQALRIICALATGESVPAETEKQNGERRLEKTKIHRDEVVKMLEAKVFRRIKVARKNLFHCGKLNKKKKLQFKRFKMRHNAQLPSPSEI